MALSRPAVITPFADAGFQVQPPSGALSSGLTSVARLGFGTLNFLLNYGMQGVRYLARRGIADWSSLESYSAGDIQNDGGTIYQVTGTPTIGLAPHSDSANWSALLPPMPWQFGTGADGVHTVTGSEQLLLQAKNYSTLTVNSGGTLQTLNSILRCQTLWVKSGGRIHCDGNPGGTGAGTAGAGNDAARPDYASDGIGPWNFAPLIGGGMGGIYYNGSNILRNDWFNGTTDLFTQNSAGGAADPLIRIFQTVPRTHQGATLETPGAGGSADGGAGGGATGVGGTSLGGLGGNNWCRDEIASWISTPGFYTARLAGGTYAPDLAGSGYVPDVLPWLFQWHGGAGGSQGVVSGGSAGYPGAGGGIVCIFAYNLRIDDLNAITAKGGNGGNASGGNCGGGGPGGGGRVVIFYRNFVGTTPTLACVNPGTPGLGSGSGPTASAAAQGKLLFVQI